MSNREHLPPNHPLRNREPIQPPDIKTQVTNYVQAKLDGLARAKGYDNIISACTYATSTNLQFAQEAAEFIALRDAAWTTCWAILAEVTSGTRPIPTLAEVILELPLALR